MPEAVMIEPKSCVVRGRVVFSDGQGVPCLVHVWDCELRKRKDLGSSKGVPTSKDGSFEIAYTLTKLARSNKGAGDLAFTLTDATGQPIEQIQVTRVVEGERRVIETPQILFQAEAEETVEITVGEKAYRGPSEFDLLVAALAPHLEDAPPLSELGDEDISTLSRLSGLDSKRIQWLSTAHRFSVKQKEGGISIQTFYAWFRQHLPLELDALLAQGLDPLRHALQISIDANVIPRCSPERVDLELEKTKKLRVQQVLMAGEREAWSLGGLIGKVITDAGKKEAFLNIFLDHQGSDEALWEAVRRDGGLKPLATSLKLAFQLSDITQNHLPLVQALLQEFVLRGTTDLSSLARFDGKGWGDFMSRSRIGFPIGIQGSLAMEEAYLKALSQSVERTFPTQYVCHRLKADQAQSTMARFLDDNPGFSILSSNVGSYVNQHADALKNIPEEIRGETTKRLRALQRVYRLTKNYESAHALITAKTKIDSAFSITWMGRNAFVERFSYKLGGKAVAEGIHALAEKVQDTALHLAMEYGVRSHRIPMTMLPDMPINARNVILPRPDAHPKVLDSVVIDTPAIPGGPGTRSTSQRAVTEAIRQEASDWFSLFGSLEQGTFPEELSVHGPAAYLVDILHFLSDRSSKTPDTSAKAILFGRRPDLGEIELTCDNTSTPLPYVDLVNEALENAIALPPTFEAFELRGPIPAGGPPVHFESELDSLVISEALRSAFNGRLSQYAVVTVSSENSIPHGWTIDDTACTYTIRKENDGALWVVARSLQTKGTAAERAASPQYLNCGAYDKLGSAVYPWNLPFDLWAEETRACLNHLDVPRWKIMECLLPGDRKQTLENPLIALDYLGLTPSQADLVLGQAIFQSNVIPPEPWELWGFKAEQLSEQNPLPDPSDGTKSITEGTWIDVFADPVNGRVDVFLQQSGLTYKEMLGLLDTYYVNPLVKSTRRSIQVHSSNQEKPDTCETTQLHLDGFDGEAASRAVRFTRLWRALGWSMRELDYAITCFQKPLPPPNGATPWPASFLVALSHVKRLNEDLGIPIPRLLSWWADLDTSRHIDHDSPEQSRAASLYDELFRNPATLYPSNSAFDFQDDPKHLGGWLMDHTATLAAGLGISASDLGLLLPAFTSIPKKTINITPFYGSGIARPEDASGAWITLRLEDVVGQFTVKLQAKAADDDQLFVDVPRTDLDDDQPSAISTACLIRWHYTGGAKYLRVSVTDAQGMTPRVQLQAEVLFETTTLSPELNLANLSQLHRIACMAKALRFSIRDFLTVSRLIGGNPFSTTTESLLFVEAVGRIRESAFSLAELGYLLRHDVSPDAPLGPEEDRVSALLTELRSGLQTIASDNTFRSTEGANADDAATGTMDPDGSLTKQKLALLDQWDPALIDTIVATLGGTAVYEAKLDERFVPKNLNEGFGACSVDLVALPDNFAVPTCLNTTITYRENDGKLAATRALISKERMLLRNAAEQTGDAPLIQAVSTLNQLQADLTGTLDYQQGHLCFVGPMTTALKARFEALGNQEFKQAVGAIYDAPRIVLKRTLRNFDRKDFNTPLEALPESLVIPIALQTKVFFDEKAKQLHCRGVLMPQELDILMGLSEEPKYRNAVTDLYFAPMHDPSIFIHETVVEALFDTSKPPGDRYRVVLEKLLPHLEEALSRRLVAQTLGEAFQLETRIADHLLSRLKSPIDARKTCLAELVDRTFVESNTALPISPSAFPVLFKTYLRLHKAALVIRGFKFTSRQLGWVIDHPASDWLRLDQLPTTKAEGPADFKAWRRLQDLADLRDGFPQGEKALDELLSSARVQPDTEEGKNAAKQTWVEAVIRWTRWSGRDLEELIGADDDFSPGGWFQLKFPSDFSDERALRRLRDAFLLIKRLGLSGQQLCTLSSETVTEHHARTLREAVRAKYDEAQWLAVAKPLRDILREQQRAALVAYLLWTMGLRDSNHLYSHFLLDVEMSPNVMTSRLKQAISSVQLFVQRCLMNLEPEVKADAGLDKDWLEWKWMKSYRIWEANRKIFLYPENWIEPELRDDKSPFFKELESELLQSDLTKDSAEEAFRNYLQKLDQVAHLEVVGMHHQLESDGTDILHVFGRTPGIPHVYFYRQRVDSDHWTPWERMDIGIEGDHLIPVVWNRRLYVFWPTFRETPTQHDGLCWEIKFAWSEKKRSGWLAKRVTREALFVPREYKIRPRTVPLLKNLETNQIQFQWHCDNNSNLYIHRKVPDVIDPHFNLWIDTNNNVICFNGINDGISLMMSDDCSYSTNSETELFNMYHQQKGEPRKQYCLPSFLTEMRGPDLPDPNYPIKFKLLFDPSNTVEQNHKFFFINNLNTFFIESKHTLTRGQQNILVPRNKAGNNNRLLVLSNNYQTNAKQFNNIYYFHVFYYPYISFLMQQLINTGIDGLMNRNTQLAPLAVPKLNFQFYCPKWSVVRPPLETLEFKDDETNFGAYALYNWELFFHAPMLIASRLTQNQRYEEAQRWFHFVFNPTDTSSVTGPERYWQTRPLYDLTKDWGNLRENISRILDLLAKGADPTEWSQFSEQDKTDYKAFKASVERWRKDPFKPHLLARMRNTAYQKTVVMKYLDNLIAWADQLFRRETLESTNEATQLYILAAEILGRRPEEVPARALPRVQTYNSLERMVLDPLSNAMVQIEELVPPSAYEEDALEAPQQKPGPPSGGPDPGTRPPVGSPVGAGGSGTSLPIDTPNGAGGPGTQAPGAARPPKLFMLYFALSKNDKLLGYWDTVADRLFKIRHSMNIEGVVRKLPLFEPPIDPALLVKAVAAGVDLESALNDINGAMPHYRFNVMSQKASELCSEVKSLGQAMLAALEKRDAEHLTLVRARHETALLALTEEVRKLQSQEAVESKKALLKSRDSAATRYLHFQKLLGVQSPKVPDIGESITLGSPSRLVNIAEEEGAKVLPPEQEEMGKLREADEHQHVASYFELAASIAHPLPTLEFPGPWDTKWFLGGPNIANSLSAVAGQFRAHASRDSYQAGRSAKLGQFAMREHEWLLQSNSAAREIMQIDQQYLAAEVRTKIAERELSNHRQQMEDAQEIEESLRDKFSNEELYGWMVGRLAMVHFQSYQLAYDLAKRAERAFRFELGLRDSNFIQFGYWDNLKKGLLAGEQLSLDLKRMEIAYLEQNRREYELTKHISMALLDPLALLELQKNGKCQLDIPEALFDLDGPGQYLRRIKSVSISIPCVTGPFSGVHMTLRLLRSSLRRSEVLLGKKYGRGNPDPRFMDYFGSIESIVTSSGQNDSGLFELNLRDERYVPFEGAGAISSWELELPTAFQSFDYSTISDVILHMRFTAREGGTALRDQAQNELLEAINALVQKAGDTGLYAAFDLHRDFPNEWQALKQQRPVNLLINKDRLPYLVQGSGLPVKIKASKWFAELNGDPESYVMKLGGQDREFTKQALTGVYEPPSPVQWESDDMGLDLEAPSPTELNRLVVVINYSLGVQN